jgi:transposase-like protein
VSEVAKRLNEAVKGYHGRKPTDTYRFLSLDRVVLKQRGAAKVQKRMVLSACWERWEEKKMADFLL